MENCIPYKCHYAIWRYLLNNSYLPWKCLNCFIVWFLCTVFSKTKFHGVPKYYYDRNVIVCWTLLIIFRFSIQTKEHSFAVTVYVLRYSWASLLRLCCQELRAVVSLRPVLSPGVSLISYLRLWLHKCFGWFEQTSLYFPLIIRPNVLHLILP